MGRRGIRGLETRVEQECSISGQRLDLQWRYWCWGSPRRESQCYEWGHSRGKTPKVRAVKSSEFGEGEL